MVAEQEEAEAPGKPIDCPILVTERLVMRPPHDDDLPELVSLANNRRVAEMLARMPHPYGAREAGAFLEHAHENRGGEIVYALTLAESGAFVGCAGLNHGERGLEIGYWIGEPHWKQGFATEAAHALVDLAFRATDVGVLHAACRVVNPASRRVIQKCGFQYAGQGMLNSLAAGKVPVERYRLDRKTWISLLTWKHG